MAELTNWRPPFDRDNGTRVHFFRCPRCHAEITIDMWRKDADVAKEAMAAIELAHGSGECEPWR